MGHSEFDIIREYFAESGLCFRRDGVKVGSGDDAAVLEVPADKSLVLSTDVLGGGYHFPLEGDATAIGYRALAVNFSDLAAMAAEPFCFTLGLTLPEVDSKWLSGFSAGLKQLAEQYNCPLVGGDLNHGPLSIAIQVQGLVAGEPLLRGGARPGDRVYVSGCIGDGAVALLSLGIPTHLGEDFQLVKDPDAQQQSYLYDAFYFPRPRLELAAALRPWMSACIDLSDGLVGDLGHVLRASNAGARISLDQLPVSEALLACVSAKNAQLAALYGGDDYELCFTAAPEHASAILQQAEAMAIPVTAIGEVGTGNELVLCDATGSEVELSQHAYRHF